MSLRELIIELKVKADTAAANRLNASLDGTKARVATLDAGFLAVGGSAVDAARLSGAAMRELGSIASTTAAQMAAALGEAVTPLFARIRQQAAIFAPLVARAREASAAISARFAELQTAFRVVVAEPIARYAEFAFGALETRVAAAKARVTGYFSELSAAVNVLLVPPVRRAATAIQTALGGAFAQVQARATAAGQRVSLALQPIAVAAARVRATLAPIFTPLVIAAARTRGVMAQWGTGIAAIGDRMGMALRASISESTARTVTTVQSWLSRVSTMAQQAIARVRSAGQQKAPSAPAAASSGGGLGVGVLAGAVGGAVVGAAMAGIGALRRYASEALDNAGALNDMRAASGASGQSLQILSAIVTQAGGSQETLGKGLRSINLQLSKANSGNKEAIKLFESLGVATRNADGSARDVAQVFAQVGGALGDMTDDADRAAKAQALLGKAGNELLPAFEGGTAALTEQIAKLKDVAVTMDEQTITKLDAAGDSLDTLKLAFSKLGPNVLVAFAPLIDVLNKTLMPILPRLIKAIEPLINAFAGALGPAIEALAPLIVTVIEAFGPVLEQLGPIVGELVKQLAGALAPILAKLLPIFAQLLTAIMPLVPVLGTALLQVVVAMAPALLELAMALVPLVQQLIPVLIPLIQLLSSVMTVWAGILVQMYSAVIPPVTAAISGLIGFLGTLVASFQLLWSAVTGGFDVFKLIEEAFDIALGDMKASISGWIDDVGAYFGGLFSWVGEGLAKIKSYLPELLGGGEVNINSVQKTLATNTAGAATLPTANSSSVRNVNVTQGDRSTQISITAPNPIEAGRQVQSYMSQLESRDTSLLMSALPTG